MKAISVQLAALLVSTAAVAQTRPVVVELFTSQGCSSCPPADALLGELAKRPDVIALGFHVTYWDGMAWRDPFGRAESTERQQSYDRRLTGGQAYTPQMVIEGSEDVVGSHREAVLNAVRAANPVALAAVAFAPDGHSVAIGGGTAAAANVLLARYALSRRTEVKGGENASRALVDTNAVTALTALGVWNGQPASFPIEPPGPGEGVAVLVQAADGRILGAAATENSATSPRPAPKA
ncbi:MAG: DUF1223 domain-containing protein [Alphaproteobacteria bacterium]|nr:DUF1223 domain-containing protein [Alphaproteobacteria bacterium]MBV9553215.1 DUF1223 domain-containing protein [Alphaproteobacteria bacterium]